MNEIKEPEKRKLKLKHKINKKMFALKNYQLELVSKIGRKNTAFIKHNFQAAKLPTIDNPYLLPAVERFRDYKQLKSIKLLNGNFFINVVLVENYYRKYQHFKAIIVNYKVNYLSKLNIENLKISFQHL